MSSVWKWVTVHKLSCVSFLIQDKDRLSSGDEGFSGVRPDVLKGYSCNDGVTNCKYKGMYLGLQSKMGKSSRKNGQHSRIWEDFGEYLWLSIKWLSTSGACKAMVWWSAPWQHSKGLTDLCLVREGRRMIRFTNQIQNWIHIVKRLLGIIKL